MRETERESEKERERILSGALHKIQNVQIDKCFYHKHLDSCILTSHSVFCEIRKNCDRRNVYGGTHESNIQATSWCFARSLFSATLRHYMRPVTQHRGLNQEPGVCSVYWAREMAARTRCVCLQESTTRHTKWECRHCCQRIYLTGSCPTSVHPSSLITTTLIIICVSQLNERS